jgi:hypothetical protein
MQVPFVQYQRTNHAKLTFGRQIAIQAFTSAGVATNLATIDPHCLSTGDKVILFASESGNGGKHTIADGQAYNITKISPTAFSVPLDTSNCAITEGICVVPTDLTLISFTASVLTSSLSITGRTQLSAIASSYYIDIEGDTLEDFEGLEVGRFLFAEGVVSGALIRSISKDPLPEDGRCDDAPFFSNKKLKRTVFLDRPSSAGNTTRWRTEGGSQPAQIATSTDLNTSTVTLSIYGSKGTYSFDVNQIIAATGEAITVLTGSWTI